MEIEIRRAILADIDAIAEIIRLAFDDDIDKQRVKYLMTVSHNLIYVATRAGQVVGFVENFVTVSETDDMRLELDLLAVHPDARGQGIGKKLIEVSIQMAKRLGVDYLRALIASYNDVMRRACRRMGLEQSQELYGLYVRSRQQPSGVLADKPEFHLIWVENLTYSGAWLEGQITQQSITNADDVARSYHGDILGAVVDKADSQTINLLLDNQFEHINDYHRWTLNLATD